MKSPRPGKTRTIKATKRSTTKRTTGTTSSNNLVILRGEETRASGEGSTTTKVATEGEPSRTIEAIEETTKETTKVTTNIIKTRTNLMCTTSE